MEALWHVTATHTPTGGIGSLSNQDIADEMFWDDDADALIEALVQAKILDEEPAFRLVVHGWAERADEQVHATLAKKVALFADGSAPRLGLTFNADTRRRIASEYRNRHGIDPTSQDHQRTNQDQSKESQDKSRLVSPVPEPVPEPEPKPEPQKAHTPRVDAPEGDLGSALFAYFGRAALQAEMGTALESIDRFREAGRPPSPEQIQRAVEGGRCACLEKTRSNPRNLSWFLNDLADEMTPVEAESRHGERDANGKDEQLHTEAGGRKPQRHREPGKRGGARREGADGSQAVDELNRILGGAGYDT